MDGAIGRAGDEEIVIGNRDGINSCIGSKDCERFYSCQMC